MLKTPLFIQQPPELFSYFEAAYPVAENKGLIGTQDWTLALGPRVLKEYNWGTISGKAAFAMMMRMARQRWMNGLSSI